jgi:tRNA A-37 threonylcarbamoyl transferase component Bud32
MTTLAQEIEAKYEVLQKMGEGGMGAVYKVRHRFLDDVQVIKLMQAKFQENAELKTRFLREAKTAKLLRHPNIAEVIDFNLTVDGTAYIVMEFIEGVNLSEVMARTGGPLDHRLVITIARQALTGLGFLHRKKFVHRDISPDNLMLTRDNEGAPLIKLIDLGITKSVEETRNLTMAGKFIGKVHYASPEQFGGDVDQRSDLYSLGVVLYELLTGSKPITGGDYLNIITGHLTRPPRAFEETDPAGRVPYPLRVAVMKALAKTPTDRFQSAEEFADALKDLDVGNFDATVEVLLPASVAAHPGEGGDAMERADWDAALASNTIKAWESYLDRHATSSRAARARAQLEQLESAEEVDWESAVRSESSDAWRRYLDKHTDSPRSSMARRRLEKMHAQEMEERAWSDAVSSNTAASWDLYIAAHGSSARIEEARRLRAEARSRADEDHAWRTADSKNTVEAWQVYLSTYGNSPRAEQAQTRLRAAEEVERAWQQALAANTSKAWRQFIAEHPRERTAEVKSKLARAADREAAEQRDEEERQRKAVEQAAWDKAVSASSVEAWEEFVRTHPESHRLGNAVKRLATARKDAERARRENEEATEDAAWNAARSARTPERVRSFLESYPSGRHLGDARDLLGQLDEEKRQEARRAEEKRAEEQRAAALAEQRRLEQKREEERRAEEQRAAERRAEEERAEARRAEEKRAEEARAAAQRAEEKRAAEERAEKKRAEERLAAERKAEEQRVAAERAAAEKRAKEERAAAERVAAERAAAEKKEKEERAAAERAAAQRAAAERAAAERAAQQQRRQAASDDGATVRTPLPVAPIPAPQPFVSEPVTDVDEGTKPIFTRPIALVAMVVLIIAIVAAVLLLQKDDAVPVEPAIVEGTETGSPPAAAPGQLVIHITPWGEVRSVKDGAGKEQLTQTPLYTPVTLTLPAGSYQVEVSNPNSGRSETLTATVAAGTSARIEAELDPVDADEYLKRVLESRR